MSSQKPNQKPNTNRVIDYWPSWFDYNRGSLSAYLKGGRKDRVDVINIAFALPQADGTLVWSDVQKGEGGNYQKTKDIIQKLRAEGKRVTISVGGSTAKDWNLETPAAIQTLAENIKKFVDEYGLDGADIDYESLDRAKRDKVFDLIVELRRLMPQDKYTITYAAWSIGAYGKANPGHEHPEWTVGNEGVDINLLRKAGHLLDWVNVMSYDAFEPGRNYNPIQAIEAYKSLLGSAEKVVLGVELGPHGWPAGVKTSPDQIIPWIEYVVRNNFGGVMFWTLDYDAGPQKRTGEKDSAFLSLVKSIMPMPGTGLGLDIKEGKDRREAKEAGDAVLHQARAPKPSSILPGAANKPAEHSATLLKDEEEVRRLGISDLTETNRARILEIRRSHIQQVIALERALEDQLKHVITQCRSIDKQGGPKT